MEHKQPSTLITTPFPNVGELTAPGGLHKDTRITDNYKAIVDLDTYKVFSIVPGDYRLIRHEDAITEVEESISATKELGEYEANTEFFNDGARMRRTYRFKNIGAEVVKGDMINPELHVFNSCDKTWPFIIHLGAFRLVSENEMVVGHKFLRLRERHIYELGQMNVAEEVETALERLNQQAQEWKGWTEKKLAPLVYPNVLRLMRLGVKARQEVEKRASEEASGTDVDGFPIISAWAFFNILSWHMTHNAVSPSHRLRMEGRLRAASIHLAR